MPRGSISGQADDIRLLLHRLKLSHAAPAFTPDMCAGARRYCSAFQGATSSSLVPCSSARFATTWKPLSSWYLRARARGGQSGAAGGTLHGSGRAGGWGRGPGRTGAPGRRTGPGPAPAWRRRGGGGLERRPERAESSGAAREPAVLPRKTETQKEGKERCWQGSGRGRN